VPSTGTFSWPRTVGAGVVLAARGGGGDSAGPWLCLTAGHHRRGSSLSRRDLARRPRPILPRWGSTDGGRTGRCRTPDRRAPSRSAREVASRAERRFPFILQLWCVTTAKWSDRWPGQLRLTGCRATLIPAEALPGGACRARLDDRLAVDLLASRRSSADGYGLRGEVVTEHGDPPVADAEDLHQ
jgi:hypothetical protein